MTTLTHFHTASMHCSHTWKSSYDYLPKFSPLSTAFTSTHYLISCFQLPSCLCRYKSQFLSLFLVLLDTLPPDQCLHGVATGLASALGNRWIDNVCVLVASVARAKIEPLDCFVAASKAAPPWMSRPRSSICWTFPWPMAGVLATWFYQSREIHHLSLPASPFPSP